MSRKPGRQFFANPGPTNIPDSVLRALGTPAVDFNDPAFMELYDYCIAGLKRVLKTEHHLVMYNASGHGSWEATVVNLFSPGDTVLMIETGYFSEGWAEMAARHGIEVRTLGADWRHGVDIAAIERALVEDSGHVIKAVCAVHNETATGLLLPLAEVRAAMDAAKHPALLLSDTISSLGSMDFRMDEWGVDAVVGGSQKGLMLPVGFSFTGVSAKGMAAHREAKLPRAYFDWTSMLSRRQKSFIGTVPVNLFFGFREALHILEGEGLDNVFARHARLGEAVRRAVRAWAGNDGPQLFCTNPGRFSNSVTAILMPEGHNSEKVRATALERFNVSLGGGLGKLGGKVFRIGHLGDLNEPMVMGALAGVEMSLKINKVPHGPGALDAAMEYLAAA